MNIVEIIARRNGTSIKEAEQMIEDVKEDIEMAILDKDYDLVEDILMFGLGLEMDYIFDIGMYLM